MSFRTAALTLAAMVAFASNSLLCRGALGRGFIDATSFTTLRLAGGAAALALLVGVRELAERRNRRGERGAASRIVVPAARRTGRWISTLALFTYAIAFSLAYVRITAGTGSLLLFGAVQATMLGTGLVAGERPRAAEWLGLGVSVAGLVILTAPGVARPDPAGALLMLGAGVAWGVYSLRGRRAGDALAANAESFARGVPLALVASAVAWAAAAPRVTPAGALLALASGGLTSGIGYAIWYAALRGLTATLAAIVQLSVPPLAAAGGVALLGETLTPRLLLGGAAVLGGITLAIAAHARTGR